MDVERYERIREHVDNCPDLRKIYVSRSKEEIADPRVERLESIVGATADWPSIPAHAPPAIPTKPDDDVAIFYTSGTTGNPKGAVISHRNIISNMLNGMSAQARAFLRRGEAPPAPDPNRAAESIPDLGAVLPRDGLLCDHDPVDDDGK